MPGSPDPPGRNGCRTPQVHPVPAPPDNTGGYTRHCRPFRCLHVYRTESPSCRKNHIFPERSAPASASRPTRSDTPDTRYRTVPQDMVGPTVQGVHCLATLFAPVRSFHDNRRGRDARVRYETVHSCDLPDFFRDDLCIAFRQIDNAPVAIVFPIP